MRFDKASRWFDELPPRLRRKIAVLGEAAAAGIADPRLIPVSHGDDLGVQLDAATARFKAQVDPFALIRVSDSELSLLGAGYLPPGNPHDIDWYRFRGGVARDALSLRDAYLDSIRNAELVGLQQNWAPITRSTAILLDMLGFELPMPNGVEVHLPYRLLVDGSLFEYLAGKRVVLVGWLAPQLAEAWRDPGFADAYSVWGPVSAADIVAAVPTRSRDEGGASMDYRAVLARLAKVEYDAALLACGVAAKPIAWEIRKAGRTALDIGFVFNALLGDKERADRPVFRDVEWPS